MNRDEAKDRIDRKLLQYPYEGTIHATVAEDIIDEIYDYFESRDCKYCKRMKIKIDITENDLEDFKEIVYSNKTINWQYDTKEGILIDVEFMSEDELEQRDK